ncbi:MAG: toll/interleukin-1 receptor domain-containing protein [Verrucomicrobia bacterium]|nr:toll/interleukin-1 receptor domain-containing protein [Verrucomicrobiota bacterium]
MHTRAPMAFGAAENDPAARHYRVFISYSHADTTWAHWLMRRLEGYRVPARFHGQAAPLGVVGPRIAPVFRDRDELPTTSDLSETIRAALRESATLLVICSPASAKSRWVQEEIVAFKRLHGGAGVFAFIVGGEPKAAGSDEDCFSPALRRELGADGLLSATPAEVVAADARPHADGRQDAFVRLVAGLLGVGFDELRQRELQRRHRRMTLIAASSMLGMALTLWLAATAWIARNDARRRQEQAEDVLTFMLGDFRTELKKLGRLGLLDAVGDKSIAYFDSLNPRDLTDTALARQAKALTQIGENRMDEARYPEAARAYLAAFQRAAALAARHPGNGGMLFERGQAEFGIGFVNWKRRNLTAAGDWLTRYRDTGAALVALDPAREAWIKELASGHQVLATLDIDRRKYAEARTGFLAALKTWEDLLAAAPNDLELRFTVADAASWLGNVAERCGEFAEASARYGAQSRQLETLVAADPKNPRWRFKLADSMVFRAGLLSITNGRSAALELLQHARALNDPLMAQDPSNRRWQKLSANIRLYQARLLRAAGDAPAAARLVEDAGAMFEILTAAEPSDWGYVLRLAAARSLEADLRRAAGRADAAAAVGQALKLGDALIRATPEDDIALAEFAQACVVAGRIAATGSGGDEAARRNWQRALDDVGMRAKESGDWRLLDPAARAFAYLGRSEESRALIERLQRFGYQPFEPWPAAPIPPASARNRNQ